MRQEIKRISDIAKLGIMVSMIINIAIVTQLWSYLDIPLL